MIMFLLFNVLYVLRMYFLSHTMNLSRFWLLENISIIMTISESLRFLFCIRIFHPILTMNVFIHRIFSYSFNLDILTSIILYKIHLNHSFSFRIITEIDRYLISFECTYTIVFWTLIDFCITLYTLQYFVFSAEMIRHDLHCRHRIFAFITFVFLIISDATKICTPRLARHQRVRCPMSGRYG